MTLAPPKGWVYTTLMHLVHRQTHIEDLISCANLVQDDLLATDHSSLADLIELWTSLIETRQANSAVIEDRERLPHVIVGFGMTICVPDAFAAELRNSPTPHPVLRLLELWKQRRFPGMSLSDIRKANRGEGLNILGLHTLWGLPGMDDASCAPIRDRMLDSLFANHRGYNIKSFMKEIYGETERNRHLSFGFLEINNYGRYRLPSPEEQLGNDPAPYLIGMTRAQAFQPEYEGRLIRELFRFAKPICSFTAADQELLQLALVGLGESDIARILEISKGSVKSRWDSVYAHLPSRLELELFSSEDDRLKSRILLHWLRNHPEELRPGLYFKGVDLIGDSSRISEHSAKSQAFPQPAAKTTA